MLDRLAAAVGRFPGWVLGALAVLTVALGVLASRFETVTDITEFAGESPEARAFERVEEDFGARDDAVVVLVDAGAGGDVLTPGGLALTRDVAAELARHPSSDGFLDEGDGEGGIVSFAQPLLSALAERGDVAAAEPASVDATAAEVYTDPATAPSVALLSQDFEPGGTVAEAGILIVPLDPGLDPDARAEAATAVDDVVAGLEARADAEGFAVLAVSQELVQEELDGILAGELPLLSGLSIAVILVILYVVFRRLSDVLLAFAGLVVTLVWMAGLIVLVGPQFLGITGEFSQIAIAVPVLLIGLGVDYSIHLTARYREQQAQGDDPASRAATAVRTVGRALVLVTLTTMIGFLANVVTPLPPIRDFAIFTAIGVFAAMVVMGLLVTSARCLLDTRSEGRSGEGWRGEGWRGEGWRGKGWRGKGNDDSRRSPAGAIRTPLSGESPLTRAMAAVAGIAARAPKRALGVVAVLTALGTAGALNLGTEFSQDEFIPDDADVAAAFETLEARFGGDVTEETFVVVDGDFTDPALSAAVLDAVDRLAEVEGVDTVGGEALAESPPRVLAELGQLDGNGDLGAAYDAADALAPARLGQVLSEDRATGLIIVETRAGQEGAAELAERMRDALAPVEAVADAVVITSQPLLADQTLADLVASQAQKIGFTIAAASVLLVGFYWVRHRSPALGVITMIPTLVALALVLGVMWVLGLSFNALTATITSIAIGFGVDYGIHLSNRFLEDRQRTGGAAEAIECTIRATGAALVASAATTAAAFGVLMLSDFTQLRQFGAVTAATMVLALGATLVAETSCLVLWERRRRGVARRCPLPTP